MFRVSLVPLAFCAVLALAGCDEISSYFSDHADMGYDDGYAVGYNTTCEIRATMIHGLESQEYQTAYRRGYIDGSEACRRDRVDGKVQLTPPCRTVTFCSPPLR